MNKFITIFLTSILIVSCNNNNKNPQNEIGGSKPDNFIPTLDYKIINTLPHDTTSFTEGLLFYDQQLFESTGSPDDLPQTKSIFGTVDFKTGKINKKVELDKSKYFGEGIVFFKDKVYQLTYKNQVGFIYNSKTYKTLGQFSFQNKEGWGLTTDGTYIIMSDGTNILTYLDPNNLKVVKTISVSNSGYAEDFLNELEYINGFIYANIWTKNYIVKIDPSNGKVVALLDLSSLLAEAKSKYPNSNVINGIAFDSVANKIYVTGKLWPNIYQIEFPH